MKTFKQAKAELWQYLSEHGWTVVLTDSRTGRPLITPYANSPELGMGRTCRLWFKPQAVYVTCGNWHSLNTAHSLWVDVRKDSPETILEELRKRGYLEKV